jgi:hypothetical protein
MLSTFGQHADRIRGALPPGLSAVVYDEDNVGMAVLEAVGRRERAERFYALALVDDLRVSICNQVANELNVAPGDFAARQARVAALGRGELVVNGEPVLNFWDPKKASERFTKVNNVQGLCDEVLFRSYFEYNAYARHPRSNAGRFRVIKLADGVPPFERQTAERSSVLVWTGRRYTAVATLALMGLEAFDGNVAYVGDAPLPQIRARFIPRDPSALADALRSSGCIVCADPADPADAVAFAQRNVPVVAPLTSGAYEFVRGIVSWDAGDAISLPAAVTAALARRA